jgi:hypothetical protein
MEPSIKHLIVSLAALVFLTACASRGPIFSTAPASQIFYKDGKVAYVASCKGANWGSCLEKAGMICRNAGYTILEKNNQWAYGGDEKEMVFACNGKPDAIENRPSSS